MFFGGRRRRIPLGAVSSSYSAKHKKMRDVQRRKRTRFMLAKKKVQEIERDTQLRENETEDERCLRFIRLPAGKKLERLHWVNEFIKTCPQRYYKRVLKSAKKPWPAGLTECLKIVSPKKENRACLREAQYVGLLERMRQR